MLSDIGISYTVRYCYFSGITNSLRYEQIGCFCNILQFVLIQNYTNCLRFPLVATVSNSYYSYQILCLLKYIKVYFCRENMEKEYFIISLLHGVMVSKY